MHWEEEQLRLEFDEPQRAATPGQAVVFYREEDTMTDMVEEAKLSAAETVAEETGKVPEKVLVVAGGAVICRGRNA